MRALTSSIVKMTSRSLPIGFSSFDDIDYKDIIMTKIKFANKATPIRFIVKFPFH